MGFFEVVVAVAVFAFIASIYFTYVNYKKKKSNIQELKSSGFKFDHHMNRKII